MEGSVMMLILGAFLVFLGVMNRKGDISSIHWYQRSRVLPEDVPSYGKWMGTGSLIIGGSVILTALLQLIIPREEWMIIIAAGCMVGLAMMLYAQLKYNGRMMMKRKLIAAVIVILIVLSGISMAKALSGKRPFLALEAEEVAAVAVTLTPPEETFALDEEEIEELTELLQQVVVYGEDDSYEDYAGQAVRLQITLKDGTQMEAVEFYPFFILNGVGYKMGETGSVLNAWANELRQAL